MTFNELDNRATLLRAGDKLPGIFVRSSALKWFSDVVDKSLPLMERKYSMRRFARFPHDPDLFKTLKKR